MDPIKLLVEGAQALTHVKIVLVGTVALTLYDHMLMFDHEVRYIWRGRKTWTSYLYILNRFTLTGYQFWMIWHSGGGRHTKTQCRAEYYAQVVLVTFFLLTSDIFIMLRVYAVTFGNKALAIYFGTLMLAKVLATVASTIIHPPTVIVLPPIPLDAFNVCAVAVDLRPMLIPCSIGTAFEISAFLVIIWYTYRNKSALKFSALVRTIVAEATVYFITIVALQTYGQLMLAFTRGTNQQLSFLVYSSLSPILTMRFAVSLKRSADPRREREWKSARLSTVNFASSPMSDARTTAVSDSIEMDPVDLPNGQP